jgi:hypothetical protein
VPHQGLEPGVELMVDLRRDGLLCSPQPSRAEVVVAAQAGVVI